MKRILILGPSGSGKSTLAIRIGRVLNIPVIHLDRHYWSTGWQETPDDEWIEKIRHLISEPQWVMDGNYTSTLVARMKRADTAIFIDFPRRISYLRIFLRLLKNRGASRSTVTDGCEEKIDWEFLEWIWYYWKMQRPRILRYLTNLDETKNVFILHNQKEIERFMKLLRIRTDWIDKQSPKFSEFTFSKIIDNNS
jgi:adenylate kinase family enzyme